MALRNAQAAANANAGDIYTDSTTGLVMAKDKAGNVVGLSFGQRVEYSRTTSTSACTGVSTITNMSAFDGNGPSITLPSDGHTYRIVLNCHVLATAQAICAVGIGASGTTILKYARYGTINGELYNVLHIEVDVVASGQTISCFGYSSSGTDVITLEASATSPVELSAVLVAP